MKHSESGALYTDIVLEIFRLSGALVAAGDELVRGLGLTSARWKVLGAVSLSDEPMTVAKIASVMGQTRQGVQRLADAMESEGILEYADNPYHKKAKLVRLTEKGTELYAQADRIQIEWSNRLSEDIDIDKLATALDTLKKIEGGLKE